MEPLDEAKDIVHNAKNICIFPEKNNEEGIACALTLFYTLKELGKNVNLILDDVPKRLKFLTPSLDYISYPKNFVISIPSSKTEISQIHYEKKAEGLNINLTLEKGNIKKDDISFYFTGPETDALISIGMQQFENINASIINIDNREQNKGFGKINLIYINKSLSEIVFNLIKSFEGQFKANSSQALLTAMVIASNNFQSPKISPEMLEAAAHLIKNGAKRDEITSNLYEKGV